MTEATNSEPSDRAAEVDGAGMTLIVRGRRTHLHPNWLRDQSTEPGQIEPTNRQRLFTPHDISADIAVTWCDVAGGVLTVGFSDAHVASFDLGLLESRLDLVSDGEEPPPPVPWPHPVEPFPYVDWRAIGWRDDDADPDAVVAAVGAFFTHGFVVLRDVPVEPGTLLRVAERLGYVSGNNFGWLFDVRAEPRPTDLAFTAIGLLAHTDLPYRQPVPGIQMLHCLVNEAPGGDSTLVDGLVAANVLATEDPEAHAALVDIDVDYRYDIGSDTVVNRGHILEYDRRGRLAAINFNTKLDSPVVRAGSTSDLDAWYRGRRWLTQWLNHPAHQATFRLAPGDVTVFDNRRILHGRTAFDPSGGYRHLQGCYIEHDGPNTMYRMAVRRRREILAE